MNAVNHGISYLGVDTAVPVLLGPISMVHFRTFIQLETATDIQCFALLEQLIPVYKELISKLATMGIK
jgi:hypothetical protein